MTKYEQIVADIISRINLESLATGSKLPSVREMMVTYNCSKATVLRSMQELQQQEVIYAKNRSGYFVLGKKEQKYAKTTVEYDFSSSGVTSTHFTFGDFQKCVTQAMTHYQLELFQYGLPKGLPVLTKSLATLFADYAVYAKEVDIFVTSGIQEALYILSQIDFPNGNERILVEQPSYNTYIQTLKLLNKEVSSITRDFRGIDLIELERLFREEQIKFFYLMPRIHNPLGTTLPQKQMKQLIELAERYDVYLIEDDYLADFVHADGMLLLHYHDTAQRVIYLKSFSKIVFPGIRIGAVVLPAKLHKQFEQYKRTLNISTDVISQLAMTTYIENGMFAKNKTLLKAQARVKAELLNQSLLNELTDVVCTNEVCVHSTIQLAPKLNKHSLIRALLKEGIKVDTLADSYLETEEVPLLKLNVSRIGHEMIEEGIQKLARVLREFEKRSQ